MLPNICILGTPCEENETLKNLMRLLQWSNTVLCTLVLAGFHNQFDWALETHPWVCVRVFLQRLNKGGTLTLTGQGIISWSRGSWTHQERKWNEAWGFTPVTPALARPCPRLGYTVTSWLKKRGKRGDKARWAQLLCFLSLWDVSKQHPSTNTGGSQSCSHAFPTMGAVHADEQSKTNLSSQSFLCQVFCHSDEKNSGYNIISSKYNPSTMEVEAEELGIRGYTISYITN